MNWSWLQAYPTLIKVYLSLEMEYRIQSIVWIISGVMPLIMLNIWLLIAETNSVGSFDSGTLTSYYILVIFMRRMVGVWLVWDYDNDIRSGELVFKLLQPIAPIHLYFTRTVIGPRAAQFIVVTPLVLILSVLLDASYPLTGINLIACIFAVFGALLLEFFSQMLIGSLAFWITRAVAIADSWFLIVALFSGWIIPIDLFPDTIANTLQYLPFRYMLSFPIEIVLNRLSLEETAIGFAVLASWTLVLMLGFNVLWRRGLRQYEAFGG